MARNSCIRWFCYWWCLCICVLCSPVNAATRQNVTIPSNTDITAPGRGVATRSGDLLHVGVREGEYIEATRLNKKVPVNVTKTVDYSIPRTINQTKNLLKNNLASLLLTGVIAGSVAAVGWVMDEGTKVVKKPDPDTKYPPPQDVGWCSGSPGYCDSPSMTADTRAPTAMMAGQRVADDFKTTQSHPSWANPSVHMLNCTSNGTFCTMQLVGSIGNTWNFTVWRYGNCSSWESEIGGGCLSDEQRFIPVTDADIDATLAPYINSKDPEWLKGLLRESCQGSQSPEACMQSLRDNVTTSGPSTVVADKTTTTGTYLKPDGTVGTTKSETTTTYNIKYGPTYFDFSETKNTTTYKDDQKIGDETTKETDDVTEEKPAEEPKDDSAPCVTGCSGPAYEDLYKPTDKTKEKELDSYSSRVQQIPLMKAVVGLFNVNAPSTQCPVWQIHNQLDILGTTLPLDLVFDQHCLPWFQDKKYFIQAIVLIGFAYVSIRIGLL